jgi:N-acetylmuramoyl-L-alanine amidase
MSLLGFVVAALAKPPSAPAPPIVERPLLFDAGRMEGTLSYLRQHVDPARADVTFQPRAIVLHWTAVPTLEGSFAVFAPPELAGRPELDPAGRVNVSAHFLVERDGTIYRLVPETVVARHVIGLNDVAIGIENVGGGAEHPLTDAQVQANAALVRYLAGRFRIKYLLGHSEYQELEGTRFFRELDPTYRTEKPDPGPEFLAAVRAEVAELRLRSP